MNLRQKLQLFLFPVTIALFLSLTTVFADSNLTKPYDSLFLIVTIISAIVALGVVILMLYFAYRFRENNETDRTELSHTTSRKLEMTWTLIAIGIVILLMIFSYPILINDVDNAAGNIKGTPDVVIVEGTESWQWHFWYLNQTELDLAGMNASQNPVVQVSDPVTGVQLTTLDLLVNQPYKLIFWASGEWIHSFYMPAMNFKMDVTPGYNNTFTFVPTKVGTFPIYCAEYCGPGHSFMRGQVIVHAGVP